MSTELKQPSDEVLERYYQEIGATPETIARDVATLQDWLEKQPHLPHNVGSRILERFLINSKNSMERAKSKLDHYYSARTKYPEYYSDRDPADPDLKAISQLAYLYIWPIPTTQGSRVFIGNMFDYDLKKCIFPNVIRLSLCTMDGYLEDDSCVSNTFIFDSQGASLGHAALYTPSMLVRIIELFKMAYPRRVAALHLVNCPSFVEPIVKLLKKIVSSKVAQRIFVHPDMSSLHNHISKDILPPEYGGTYPVSLVEMRVEHMMRSNPVWVSVTRCDLPDSCGEERVVLGAELSVGRRGQATQPEVEPRRSSVGRLLPENRDRLNCL